MKVVFLEEVEGTARTGDVKNVANGFARNYLLPRKLAAPATKHYIAIAEQKATKEAKRQDRVDEEARERLLPLVEGQEMTIEVLVGEQGKLFGSVTSRDIAERLHADTGVELEHRQVALNQPIREIGTHEVSVRLTRNVIANITVHVHPEGGMPEEPKEPDAEASADEPPAEEAAPAPEEAAPVPEKETTTETSDAPDEATEDEEKGNASQDGS